MNVQRYSASKNYFFILPLASQQDFLDLKNDDTRLTTLAEHAIDEHIDSVMIIVGNPRKKKSQGFHVMMYVFEPRSFKMGQPQSGWSTMCGNGVRAVAEYLFDMGVKSTAYLIASEAGIHEVVRSTSDGWSVNMGFFTTNQHDLRRYVRPTTQLSLRLFSLSAVRHFLYPTIFVGFHFHNKKNINGEPHAVVFRKKWISKLFIKRLTKKIGNVVTNNKAFFPREINTSVAFVRKTDKKKKRMYVRAATYERNIYYVTQACGTASTVIASLLFEQKLLDNTWTVVVEMPGGDLFITKDDNNQYYLTGTSTKDV